MAQSASRIRRQGGSNSRTEKATGEAANEWADRSWPPGGVGRPGRRPAARGRHAFADHGARHAGVRNAQFLLGHATIGTTETYLGKPTLEELASSVDGFTFGAAGRTDVLGDLEAPAQPSKATTGIEPVYTALQAAA